VPLQYLQCTVKVIELCTTSSSTSYCLSRNVEAHRILMMKVCWALLKENRTAVVDFWDWWQCVDLGTLAFNHNTNSMQQIRS
jgi:hypothetical protein